MKLWQIQRKRVFLKFCSHNRMNVCFEDENTDGLKKFFVVCGQHFCS